MTIKIFNLRIDISFLFLALLSFLLYFDKKIFLSSFFSTFVHEFGHIFASFLCGQNIQKIKINAFNFNIIKSQVQHSKISDNIFILVSGPILNLILAIFLYVFYLDLTNCNHFIKLLCINNFLLFLLNILPIKNLDGGQIFYYFLIKKIDEGTAVRIVEIISILFLIPITILGLTTLLQNKYNFSLLTLCIYLFLILIFKKSVYL